MFSPNHDRLYKAAAKKQLAAAIKQPDFCPELIETKVAGLNQPSDPRRRAQFTLKRASTRVPRTGPQKAHSLEPSASCFQELRWSGLMAHQLLPHIHFDLPGSGLPGWKQVPVSRIRKETMPHPKHARGPDLVAAIQLCLLLPCLHLPENVPRRSAGLA